MAKGDRVVVGTGYVWSPDSQKEKKEHVMAYMPVLNEGQMTSTPDGGSVVQNAGGVLAGSTGTINGAIINVHRSYLHNSNEYTPASGGRDFVQMVPVFLDTYQRVGYFPVDNIRIFGGSHN